MSAPVTTPCKLGKENAGGAQLASTQANISINTPTKTRKTGAAIGCGGTPLRGVAEGGPDFFTSREVQVKNTFLHFSPAQVKSPVTTPPKTVPSNMGSSGGLFASEGHLARACPVGDGGGRIIAGVASTPLRVPPTCWPSPAPFAEHPLPMQTAPSSNVSQLQLQAQSQLPAQFVNAAVLLQPPQVASKVLLLSDHLSSPGPRNALSVGPGIISSSSGLNCGAYSACGTWESCDSVVPGDAGELPSVPPLPQVQLVGSTMPSSTMYSGSAFSAAGSFAQTDTTCFTNAFTHALPPSMPPTLPPALPPAFHTLGANTADGSAWFSEASVSSCGFPQAHQQPQNTQHQQLQHQQPNAAPYYQHQVHTALQPCQYQQQLAGLHQYAEHASAFSQHGYSSTGPGGVTTSVATVIAQTPALAPVLPTSANALMPPPPAPPQVPAHAAEPAPPLQPPTVPVMSECTLPRIRM